MSMSLNSIVDVVITRQTQTVTEQGFGTPLILGTSNKFTQLLREYSSMQDVAEDFDPSDREYIAAQDIFSQDISPNLIFIGRRSINNAQVLVQTAMTGEDYILTINDVPLTVSSSSTTTNAVVTLNNDLVPENRINVSVNGTVVGTITSVINFDINFDTGNSIVATINGAPIAAVPYNVLGQAATMEDLRAALQATAAILTATVTDTREITALFATPGANTINSVITGGGTTQPIATIAQGGFVFTTSSQNTMNLIASAIESQFGNIDATVSVAPYRVLTLVGPVGVSTVVNSFVVQGGTSQAGATITNPLQAVTPNQIATDIVAAIATAVSNDPNYPVSAVNNGNGLFTLQNRFPGTPWTLRVDSTIIDPNSSLVRVNQVAPNVTYEVTLNGIVYSFTSDNSLQTAEEVSAILVGLINATPQAVDVTAVDNLNGTFVVNSNVGNTTFSISATPDYLSVENGLIVQPLAAVNTPAQDLDLINAVNDSWYALISTDRTPATVMAIAAWTQAHVKLFGTASNDPAIINVPAGSDTTSVAAQVNQLGYTRTFVMYHQDADTDYPEAAWFGRVLPLIPGSETWKFKTLAGVARSNLTTTQSNTVLAKKANTYQFVGGIGITGNGTVGSGEFIDIIRGIDWLTARIQQYVFQVLANNNKVAYTNAGIATIEAEVRRALQEGEANDLLATEPPYTVTVPNVLDVPAVDKAARILRNVKFQATLSGAIHSVVIKGVVSV